jgi:methyl-accepting chemotaxis protein
MLIKKLIACIGAGCAAVSLAVGGVVASEYDRARSLMRLQADSAEQLASLMRVAYTCSDLKFRAMSWTITRRAAQKERYQEVKSACAGRLQELAGTGETGSATSAKLKELQGQVAQFAEVMEDIQSNMTDESRNMATAKFIRQAEPLSQAIEAGFGVVLDAFAAQAQTATVGASQARDRVTSLLVLVALSGLAVAGGVLQFMYARVVRPVGRATDSARALAEGNLSQGFGAGGRSDEVSQLLQSLESMRLAWVSILGGVRESAASISGSSRSIDDGNRELTERTGLQAAQLQRTASDIEDMSRAVAESSSNAAMAAGLAREAVRSCEAGRREVTEVRTRFQSIQTGTHRIAEMTQLIDTMAFQTNILALNAAVEAARAGDQGRGFAVVASEVRQLANRSAMAAKEIGKAIAESTDQIDAGATLVMAADRSMNEILERAEGVASLVSQIARSSDEQRNGIQSVSETVSEIDVLTQRNAGMVVAANEALGDLAQRTVQLEDVLLRFRLPQAEPAAVSAAS